MDIWGIGGKIGGDMGRYRRGHKIFTWNDGSIKMEVGYLMLIILVFLFIGGGGFFLCLYRCYKRRIQNVGIVAHPNQVKF